ncbi:hypothetical protein QG37_00863 [Candidozyma auris]|uniref:Uncharacterized protein n=1 Tax=Candidozyma auris TaxID=498019 RepID=A0A0L0P7H0_CANAR|nr:hypothetical protein QG37_00863 [[Candida] auris]
MGPLKKKKKSQGMHGFYEKRENSEILGFLEPIFA